MNFQGLSQDWNDLTTLISIPNRGQFGNPRYRGNYAGNVLAKLVDHLQRSGIAQPFVYDPMGGREDQLRRMHASEASVCRR